MSHDHQHHRHSGMTSPNRAFRIGIALNAGFVVAEFIAGFWYNSMGLISDAGHNLADVFSLVLAMLAFRLARINPTLKYTYGYKKSTILVSLFNALLLMVTVGFIIGESVDKLFHPRPVDGDAVAWVAGIGVLINAVTAWLFVKDKEKDLNIKGAYLHMAADALVSVGVVISGILIQYTGRYFIDPLVGILIALVIIYSTWGLLRDSLRLSLDGVPHNIDVGKIGRLISSVPGVTAFHHMHIWALSTTEIAMTTHIVVNDMSRMEQIKRDVKCRLYRAGIVHTTLEFELPGQSCEKECCH